MSKSTSLFRKPFGPNARPWGTMSMGTTGGRTCGFCGRRWPEGEDLTLSRILGIEIVEECCGGAIDKLFDELGELFAAALLEDFARDPMNPRYHIFMGSLRDALKDLHERWGTFENMEESELEIPQRPS